MGPATADQECVFIISILLLMAVPTAKAAILEDLEAASDKADALATELNVVRPELQERQCFVRVVDENNLELYRGPLDPAQNGASEQWRCTSSLLSSSGVFVGGIAPGTVLPLDNFPTPHLKFHSFTLARGPMAGALMGCPSTSNIEPWQGQSQQVSKLFQCRWQPT